MMLAVHTNMPKDVVETAVHGNANNGNVWDRHMNVTHTPGRHVDAIDNHHVFSTELIINNSVN